MPILEFLAALKGGVEVINKISPKRIEELWKTARKVTNSGQNRVEVSPSRKSGTTYAVKELNITPMSYTPAPLSEYPLQTLETSSMVYRPTLLALRIILLVLLITAAGSIAIGVWEGNEFGFYAFFLIPPLLLLTIAYLANRGNLVCLGPYGMIVKYGPARWFITRWIDIYEIQAFGSSARIELKDHTKHPIDLPKKTRREAARLIRAHVPLQRYTKAEQLIRIWEFS